jgi:hypothetical protein
MYDLPLCFLLGEFNGPLVWVSDSLLNKFEINSTQLLATNLPAPWRISFMKN